jgi:myo-inositol 2-dehydrogenase/D-chiro-inositol 1-dehydrogenase
MPSPERLGVLLLSGVRHQDVYARHLAADPRLRLVALAEEPAVPPAFRERGERLAAAHGLPFVADVEAALADPAVEIVSVASEPARHARLALDALAAGKHVLVDKPVATRTDDADRLAEAACAARGRATYVHRLFAPQLLRARERIDAGAVGLPRLVSIHWTVAGGLDADDWETPVILDPALSGGGELANFLGYPVDSLSWLTGLEPRSVYASTSSLGSAAHERHGVESLGVLTLELERQVVATVVVGRTTGPHPAGGVFRIAVTGSHGAIVADEERPLLQVNGAARPVGGGATRAALTGLVDDFVRAVLEEREPLRSLADGARAVHVLEAAYESARTGRVVAVRPS